MKSSPVKCTIYISSVGITDNNIAPKNFLSGSTIQQDSTFRAERQDFRAGMSKFYCILNDYLDCHIRVNLIPFPPERYATSLKIFRRILNGIIIRRNY